MKSINENLQTNGLLKELLVGQQENANLIQKLLKDIERLYRQDEQLSEENGNLKNKLKNLEKLQGKLIIFSCNISICQLLNQYLRDKKGLMFILAANGIAFYVHLPEEEHSARGGQNTIRPRCYKLRKRLQYSIWVIHSSTTWILCLQYVFPNCNWFWLWSWHFG